MSPNLAQLREALKRAGVTRAEISRACDITEGQLSRFVRGERGLSIETAERLADYLGLELVLRKKTKRKGYG